AAAAAARVHALAANLAAHANGDAGAPISATPLLHRLRAAVGTLRSLAETADGRPADPFLPRELDSGRR
ncbi:hypothetical protein ACWEVC_05245, partial [Nocardia africana]